MAVTDRTANLRVGYRRALGAGIVAGLGASGLVIHITLGLKELQEDVLIAIFGVLTPVLLSILLVAAGYLLVVNDDMPDQYILRSAAWCLLGTAVLSASGVLIILYQGANGVTLVNRFFVVSNSGTWGATIGVLFGIYEVKIKLSTQTVTEQKERFEFLNQILRHEILNNMNLILAKAQRIEGHVDASADDHLDSIREHGHDIVSLIQRVRILTNPELRETESYTEAVHLETLLGDQLRQVRSAYRDATFEVDGEIPEDVRVGADDLVEEVFHNLLHNAVRHNDKDAPRVRIRVEEEGNAVCVRVSDNGPGIPDAEKEAVFERGKKSDHSQGGGLGLYIVDMLVRSYGGDIWVEDSDLGGATFVTELPKAQAPSTSPRSRELASQQAFSR